MIRPGQPWGRPAAGPADAVVRGGDRDLARAAEQHPGALLRFVPAGPSDVARAVGLDGGAERGWEVPMDALEVAGIGPAANAVVLGRAPDRLGWSSASVPVTVEIDGRPARRARVSTVVVAIGEYLRGHDLVPRGHPGDGRAEILTFRLGRRERRAMRRRLTGGEHLPHPRIDVTSGRRIRLRADRPLPLEVDGEPAGRAAAVEVTVVPAAYRLSL
jgi:hypothetical protein